eukprot:12406716-Karenia_brevis.AAC.1
MDIIAVMLVLKSNSEHPAVIKELEEKICSGIECKCFEEIAPQMKLPEHVIIDIIPRQFIIMD